MFFLLGRAKLIITAAFNLHPQDTRVPYTMHSPDGAKQRSSPAYKWNMHQRQPETLTKCGVSSLQRLAKGFKGSRISVNPLRVLRLHRRTKNTHGQCFPVEIPRRRLMTNRIERLWKMSHDRQAKSHRIPPVQFATSLVKIVSQASFSDMRELGTPDRE